MPLSDYAHWNEDAEYMWWHEEGKHVEEPPDPDTEDDHYFGDPNMWPDDPHYECEDPPEECIRDGNFDQKYGDPFWACSSCGTYPFRRKQDGTFEHVMRREDR